MRPAPTQQKYAFQADIALVCCTVTTVEFLTLGIAWPAVVAREGILCLRKVGQFSENNILFNLLYYS